MSETPKNAIDDTSDLDKFDFQDCRPGFEGALTRNGVQTLPAYIQEAIAKRQAAKAGADE